MKNMHIIPRSIMKNFKPKGISWEEWEEKIKSYNNAHVDISNKDMATLDKVYHIFERVVPDIVRSLENKENKRFTLENQTKFNPNKIEMNPDFQEWYDSLSFDQKFTGFPVSFKVGDAVINSFGRFAGILELLVVGIFIRSVINYGEKYTREQVLQEISQFDSFINNVTPVSILRTSIPRELDDIANICTWKKTKKKIGSSNDSKDFIDIQIRISRRVTLLASIHVFWTSYTVGGYSYHWKDIYNPVIHNAK